MAEWLIGEMVEMKILVVDDEVFICELLDEYLSMYGYQVITAVNGQDAILKFEADRPHMVFLDLSMPGMSGMDVLCKIREIDSNAGILVLSAFGGVDVVQEAMQASYDAEITDEFVEPTLMVDGDEQPMALVEDGDSVVFFNFRGDRPREITRAFVDEEFNNFDRGARADLYYVCLTEYDATIKTPVAFPKPPKMKNIVGDYWGRLGLKQFRCAETEKYAHVTFFFNDYTEAPFAGEERQIVPSPKVRTYDMQPEMSAAEVTEIVLERLDSNEYDVMVVNFANPDMVGHTGVMEAALKAAVTVDKCVGKILEKIEEMGGSAIITADHGNLELMYDMANDMPFTAHTTFPVPFIVFDKEFKNCKLREGGRLADVIPTALHIMGLDKPAEMTGESLIIED